jgi:hypothetical protein
VSAETSRKRVPTVLEGGNGGERRGGDVGTDLAVRVSPTTMTRSFPIEEVRTCGPGQLQSLAAIMRVRLGPSLLKGLLRCFSEAASVRTIVREE